MNRSRLNGIVLGSGHHAARVRLAVDAALQLVGSLRVSIRKKLSVVQTMELQGRIRIKQQVAFAVTQTMELAETLSGHRLQRVYLSVVERMQVVESLGARVNVRLSGAIDAVLGTLLRAKAFHRVHPGLLDTLALENEINATDYYIGFAPEDRCSAVAGENRFVAVPGSENISGV